MSDISVNYFNPHSSLQNGVDSFLGEFEKEQDADVTLGAFLFPPLSLALCFVPC